MDNTNVFFERVGDTTTKYAQHITNKVGETTNLASNILGQVGDTSSDIAFNIASKASTSTNFIKKNVEEKMPGIIIGALVLIASLAWNNFFLFAIEYYIPKEYREGLNVWAKILYAFVLSVFIIILIGVILYYLPQPIV